MSDRVYVDKEHYDALLRVFGKVKTENATLRDMLRVILEKTTTYDDRVLEDIHQFTSPDGTHQLNEEKAYLIGAFNAMTAIRYNLEEMEAMFHV